MNVAKLSLLLSGAAFALALITLVVSIPPDRVWLATFIAVVGLLLLLAYRELRAWLNQ